MNTFFLKSYQHMEQLLKKQTNNNVAMQREEDLGKKSNEENTAL